MIGIPMPVTNILRGEPGVNSTRSPISAIFSKGAHILMESYTKSGDVPSVAIVNGRRYLRIALNTPDFAENENLPAFAGEHTPDRLKPDDILVLRADAISLSQGRFFEPGEPTPRKATRNLCKWGKRAAKSKIYENPRILEAMRQELGGVRILFAAFAGLFGRRRSEDWFYRIAGDDCRSIFESKSTKSADGEGRIIFPPENPEQLAAEIADVAECRVLIADLRPETEAVRILAASENYLNRDELESILSGAPMTVGQRRVPICIIRAV